MKYSENVCFRVGGSPYALYGSMAFKSAEKPHTYRIEILILILIP